MKRLQTLLLALLSLGAASAERPLLNVWEGGTLVREVPGRHQDHVVRERGRQILASLPLPREFKPPMGSVLHLACLDGTLWLWGRTGVPMPRQPKVQEITGRPYKRAQDYFRALQEQRCAEEATRRSLLYRSRDFRTWERVATAPLPDTALEIVHPLRDGSFLGLRVGTTPQAVRLHLTGTGLLEPVETLPWAPPAPAPQNIDPPSWSVYQGQDSALLLVDGPDAGCVSFDLAHGAQRWREDSTRRPEDHPWRGLAGHRQIGPDGRLWQCYLPPKARGTYPPAVERGAGMVISSHMSQRVMSPANRLVALALRERLAPAWGDYQREARIQALDLRTGTWEPRNRTSLRLTSVDTRPTLWGIRTRSRDEALSFPMMESALTFRGDGSSALVDRVPSPYPWVTLLNGFRP